MILEIQNILKRHGVRDTMLNKNKRQKLAIEILGILGGVGIIAIFFFLFLKMAGLALALAYCEEKDIILDDIEYFVMDSWIQSISMLVAVFLFSVLFLFLLGQKLAYVNEIISGVEALRTHKMDFIMRLEGNNELTELAESINFLSATQRELQLQEKQMQEEKEKLIRELSHDIRTPLTSILSYSEYMLQKKNIEQMEMTNYISMMQQKSEQIKILTDRLLEGGKRKLELFENAKFLMQQLAEEWAFLIEDTFSCVIDMEDCPNFSGEFDVHELQRIFDNLASNIEKYADRNKEVTLKIFVKENRLIIEQTNGIRIIKNIEDMEQIESHKIGLQSIRRIAEHYGGNMEVLESEELFWIRIVLSEVFKR